MANLKNWILEIANGEDIEAIIIGEAIYHNEIPDYRYMPKGVLLNWQEAQQWLNYEFEDFFTIDYPPCNAICVWTKTKIIILVNRQGYVEPYWLPRNPIPMIPLIFEG